MRKARSININTAEYWNNIYGSPEKREEYRKNEKGTSTKETTNRFLEALKLIKDWDRVLDIGCGIGTFTKLVKDTYPHAFVWGVDISDKVIADNLEERKDITYRTGVVGNLPTQPNHFDVVFAGEVLEHLDDPDHLFMDAFVALKAKGTFVISTPLLDVINIEEHMWFFSPEDIIKLFEDHGFKEVALLELPDDEGKTIIYAKGVKP